MKRPPKKPFRWVADHPVLGSILVGPLFATLLAVNFLAFTHWPRVVIAIGFVFYCLYGPFLVRSTRRNIERWDAAHPAG